MYGIFSDIYQIYHRKYKNEPNVSKYASPMNPFFGIWNTLIRQSTLFAYNMPGGRGDDGSESASANCSGAENRSNVQVLTAAKTIDGSQIT